MDSKLLIVAAIIVLIVIVYMMYRKKKTGEVSELVDELNGEQEQFRIGGKRKFL
jgi:cell division protein FtsL